MKTISVGFTLALVLSGCENSPEGPQSTAELIEGVWEYIDDFQGQSIQTDGRFVFLFGPRDGSAPLGSEAGTYVVANDTITNTINYATDPQRIGVVFRWTPIDVSGDTMGFVVMNESNEVTGRGRAVRRY